MLTHKEIIVLFIISRGIYRTFDASEEICVILMEK